ncbi:MAG TPA: thioesterase family protein [Acidimicrobiales bacterium]|nr:thioesterase family protein [Acidimicrobiales bacterium]
MGAPPAADGDDGFYVLDRRTYVPTILTQGPWDPGAQHGGPVSGLLATLVESTPSLVPMQVARLTVDLLRPVPLAPLDVERQVVREGKRIQVVDVQLLSGSDLVARASALRIRIGDDTAAIAPAPGPVVPGPDHATAPEWSSPYVPGFRRAIELRVAAVPGGGSVLWVRLGVPIVVGARASAVATLAVAADFTSLQGSGEVARRCAAINGDVNLHVLRAPRGPWVGLSGATAFSSTGTGLSSTVLCDLDGQVGAASCVQVVDPRT